jgi:endonuclease-3 related protein
MDSKKALEEAYALLKERYGFRNWWPVKHGFRPAEWEIEVGAVLTQNTSWKNVETALENLKRAGVVSREDTMRISEARLGELIRPSGYYNQKARKLRLLAAFKGEFTRENLLGIWGIGKETADSILLYARRKPVFVVDAYTRRIFSRMGLIGEGWDYDRIRELFEAGVPRDPETYGDYHALIVEHAKQACRKRPLCGDCVLGCMCRRKGT